MFIFCHKSFTVPGKLREWFFLLFFLLGCGAEHQSMNSGLRRSRKESQVLLALSFRLLLVKDCMVGGL